MREGVESGQCGGLLWGATAADVRDVMSRDRQASWPFSPNHWRRSTSRSKRRLTWPNAAVGTLYSAEEPDRYADPSMTDSGRRVGGRGSNSKSVGT